MFIFQLFKGKINFLRRAFYICRFILKLSSQIAAFPKLLRTVLCV